MRRIRPPRPPFWFRRGKRRVRLATSPSATEELSRKCCAMLTLAKILRARIDPGGNPLLDARKRILIIDDDLSIHDLVESSLDPRRFRVEHAHDGAEGLRLLRSERP